MAGNEELVRYSFFVPRDLGKDFRRVVAKYREVRLDVEWMDSDDGAKDFQSVVDTLPKIVSHIRQEMDIKREVASIDHDLEELNGDD